LNREGAKDAKREKRRRGDIFLSHPILRALRAFVVQFPVTIAGLMGR